MTAARLLLSVLLACPLPVLAQAVAEVPPLAPAGAAAYDPWEPFNRRVFAFNQGADRIVLRPMARAYVKVTSPGVRAVVSNFFANVRLPISALHALLQGKPGVAGRNLRRFGINSTVGLLGLFDPATRFGVHAQLEDLGQTLAVWGIDDGPFLMLPLFGPSTLRDAAGGTVDNFIDPVQFYTREERRYGPMVLDLTSLRAWLLNTERYVEEAYDPYTFLRDAYRQRRLYAIHDGDPPPELLEQMLMPEDDPADLLEED